MEKTRADVLREAGLTLEELAQALAVLEDGRRRGCLWCGRPFRVISVSSHKQYCTESCQEAAKRARRAE